MTGYLRQRYQLNGIGEKSVGNALAKVCPHYHQRRQTNTACAVNPIPYRADYFGHKLHMDQNEKLIMYGVTHVAAIDGHSRFVVCGITLPIKNNGAIYENVYRYSTFINLKIL